MRSIYEKIQPLESINDLFSLKDQVGLIVGGSGAMGTHFAKVLSKAGAQLVISDLNADACEKIACDIQKQNGRRALGIACDVSDERQVDSLFESLNAEFGRLDFLISCVMAKPPGYYRDFDNYSIETWRKVLDVNLTGTFLCCRAAVRLMKKNRKGSIVIVSSIYGMVGPDQRIYDNCQGAENPYGGAEPLNAPGVYAASKGGLMAFARYLATLQQSQNIRVNLLTPGGVFDDQEDAFHKAYLHRTPMGRMAVWSDYNGAILFLVSDASRYMTGANLVVDGGWTAW